MFNPSVGPNAPSASPQTTGFDRVAWCYDALAGLVFGSALKRAQRAALLGLPSGAPRILILGGGTGWVLTEVLSHRPHATVLYLEASPKMLARARARLERERPQATAQVEFRHGTQADLKPAETFDAIITFFVLDCIAGDELETALAQLRSAQRPGAPWLLADFRPAQGGWRRLLLQLMYAFFRLTTGLRARALPELHIALGNLGLVPLRSRTFFGGALEAVVFSEETRPLRR
ncbi:class I SAM-dependent methyltransferase [Hymenobacter sp. BT683]|uniref:Class I SAM-dependent methyltransferase n=1 Tax=Hymenobacter jeongseonensis TaxID=2791027 RepID=A0ABS0IHH3_9BACT|nr:class I SAM-dependent methyltransferase [Hymenobacter jeongseonensis]MBF9237805.1 class I SAM-dependent methyltransferase [Hymenobacter jeongseonensis]